MSVGGKYQSLHIYFSLSLFVNRYDDRLAQDENRSRVDESSMVLIIFDSIEEKTERTKIAMATPRLNFGLTLRRLNS